MAVTDEFKEAVLTDKRIRVRIMLKDIMLVDPSLKLFDEMNLYADNNMEDLYDLHDGELLNKSKTDWNEEYMNQQMVAVVTNFSKERVNLLKEMVKWIYGSAASEKEVVATEIERTRGCKITAKQMVGGGIAIIGAGALIGGIVASNVPLAIIGGVTIVAGGTLVVLGANREV